MRQIDDEQPRKRTRNFSAFGMAISAPFEIDNGTLVWLENTALISVKRSVINCKEMYLPCHMEGLSPLPFKEARRRSVDKDQYLVCGAAI